MKPKHAAAAGFGSVQIGPVTLGLADWVTLARATLAVGVAGLVADSFSRFAPVALLVSLAAVALALDAVDGWVARRTRTTAAGARLDGEVDAFLILVLSVYVARTVGAWVLAIGAARYVFFAAGWPLPWLRAELPARFWRKTVAAAQGVFLTVAASHLLSRTATQTLVVVALALLTESFGRDVWWLWRHRGGTFVAAVTDAGPAVTAPDMSDGSQTSPAPDAPGAPSRRRSPRRAISVALTVLAVVIVWAALVAPDRPNDLTVTGFVRIPLEGLVLIALALVLPRTPRRIVAVTAGLALTLVIVLKAINYEVFTLYNRPYDPLGDTTQLGNGIETLRSLVGGTETKLIEVGTVVGTVVLGVLLTLSMLRLTQACGRQSPLGAAGGHGARCRWGTPLGARR